MKPLVLCILDGVGIRKEEHGNAIKKAKMPTFNMLLNKYPNSLLDASGTAVGLPEGQMGNSEVGHTNIGAGRIVYQPLEMINKCIENKTFFVNKNIFEVINHTKSNNSKLHIFGLLSDGGIHSNINHLFSLIDMCQINKIEKVYLHLFLDGRDTLPKSGISFIEQLEEKIKKTNIALIATISGRYYAMDRDNNFDRVKKVYDVITSEQEEVKDYKTYIKESYELDITDEFIEPIQVNKNGIIEDNDGIIVFNFRPDRLRELFGAITHPLFDKFEHKKYNNLKTVTMYHVSDEIVALSAYEHDKLANTFGTYIDSLGLKQLRIAETEKYAHVTYFFDGGKELELQNSNRILIPSSKVATYDLLPQMSAKEITKTLINELDKDYLDVVILNFANGDMVGHTGNMEATIKSLEVLDECLKELYDKVIEKKGTLIVTADHGNSDYMLDDNENVITSHSMSKVPLIITNPNYKLSNGKLSDIAPTMLDILDIKKPREMTGKSLISKKKLLNKSNIFVIISLIFMLSLIINYSYRLVHYYRIENPHISIKDNTLSSKIIKENKENDTNFVSKDSEYIFKGTATNNYVYYSGHMFRIMKINKDKTIKLITNENVTSLVWGYNTNYKDSYINKWLNEDFYNSLVEPNKYVVSSKFCIDEITNKTDICNKTIKTNVGLITYEEYKEALANKSYLNISKYFWTINAYKDNKVWYVFKEGGVNNNSKDSSTYHSYGIRPVINIDSKVEFLSGAGTKEDPYLLENSTGIKTGSYINYSNRIWQVVSNTDKIKLVMNDCLKVNNKCLEKSYSANSSSFNKNDYTSLAYYLNNSFYYALNKKHIVDGTWYIGEYSDNYDYKNILSTKKIAKVGLLNITELFNKNSSFTITPSNDEMINTINEEGMIYTVKIDEKLKIYPSINIDKNIVIKKGNGTLESPFEIE